MPSILVEVRRKYSQAEETALLEAVHTAVSEAFKIPSGEREGRLVVHEPHRFAYPPAAQKPEFFTHISIDCFPGRSLAAKRNLYKAVVDNLEAFGVPRDHVMILLREVSRENWGLSGGQAGCDVELGFKIEV